MKNIRRSFIQYLAVAYIIALFATGCATSTIYVVRHAEKAAPSGDVFLSGEGLQRAETLKELLKDKKIKAVYTTPYKRTFQTVSPTALHFGLDTTTYSNGDSLMKALVNIKGVTALVAGHSNTVPAMLRAIGLSPSFSGNLPDNQYDNLFIVTFKGKGSKSVALKEMKYGMPSQ